MKAIQKEVHALPELKDAKPSLGAGLAGFLRRAVFSVKLMLTEKELLTFALLQWACIAAGYFLWVQMIGWIPEEAWRQAAQDKTDRLYNIILFLWSFVCVGLVAFPLGMLSGCMGAVHVQHRLGRESTIYGCLKMVAPRAWPLWIFHWIDGWWTVNRILDRLPKKNDRRTPAQKALSEALYYAWKVATIGILPALVTGRGLVDAAKRSVDLVRKKFADILILRAGYSALCWILGVGTYIGTIFFFIKFPDLVNFKAPVESQIYKFYFWAGVPITAAVGVVMLFLRPIYVISSCDIYADYVKERDENLVLPAPPGGSPEISAMIAVIIIAAAAALVIKFLIDIGTLGGAAAGPGI
ncbi:MAG: hypothetical protein KKH28_10080 [Elusimicrobia bacterium]|nr:hypothetical protein [Elusimicrobiota bacterium]